MHHSHDKYWVRKITKRKIKVGKNLLSNLMFMKKIYSSNKETFGKKDFKKKKDGTMHEWFPV